MFLNPEPKYTDSDSITTMSDDVYLKNEPLNGDWTVLWLKNEVEAERYMNKCDDVDHVSKIKNVTEQHGVGYYSQYVQHNPTSKEISVKTQEVIEGNDEPEVSKNTESIAHSISTSNLTKHTGVKLYPCNQCDKAYAHRRGLNKHLRKIHTNEKLHQCSYCDKAFNFEDQLTKHLRMRTGNKTFQCSQCKMTFCFKKDLNGDSHVKICNREKLRYKCSFCSKAFSHRSSLSRHLNVHMNVHNEEKTHHCSRCDKVFTTKSKLLHHMKEQNRDKPFQCSKCDKAFSEKNTLVSHLSTHTYLNPYQCSQCTMTFTEKPSLLKHHLTHTGEKQYQCTHILLTCKGKYVL